MRIKNSTNWNTHDLQKLFTLCCKATGHSTKRIVEVENSNNRGYWGKRVHGLGRYGSNWVKMFLPTEDLAIKAVAQVFLHEMHHNDGLRHDEMLHCSDLDISFLNGEEIRKKEPKPEPTREDKMRKHFELVQKKMKRKQAHVKYLQTSLKRDKKHTTYLLKKYSFLGGGKNE